MATAIARYGGTLQYTQAMIEALHLCPAKAFRFEILTPRDNPHYDNCGFPVTKIDRDFKRGVSSMLGRDPFAMFDKIIAPIYSTLLLSTRRPFAFTLHDLLEKHYPEHFNWRTRAWRHATNRLLTRRASRVLCESHFVKSDIIRHFHIPENRVAVIPAPPLVALASRRIDAADVEKTRQKLGISAAYVFYPAQFWPHKNHMRLVEAFARIADLHPDLMLVFTGQKGFEHAKVMARVRESNLGMRVKHVGYVDEDELAALYVGATVVAIPTLFESISIPVWEAFALGRAVCASNVQALPEQIGDAGLLFDPTSVDEIASAIHKLAASANLRRDLAERGRRRIAAVTHDAYAARLTEVLDTL